MVIIIGLYIRLRHVGSLFFWIDESTSTLIAQRIAEWKGQTYMNGVFYGRAILYHHYAAIFIKLFKGSIYFVMRAANIPFFIGIILGIYYLGKYCANKFTGLISAFIFCFSWISISIFREARFYEMWLAFYLPSLLLIYKFTQTYFETNEFDLWNFVKQNLRILIIACILILISLDTQELTFLTLYPLAILGTVFFFKKNRKGLILFLTAILFIISALIYKHQFSISNIVFFEGGPTLRTLYGRTPVLAVWDSVYSSGYQYLFLIFILYFIFLKSFRSNYKLLFTFIFVFSWYFIVALQGHDVKSIRYFYPILPLIAIQTASTISYCFILFEKHKFLRYELIIILLALLTYSVWGGIQESESILTNSSKNLFKNETFKDGLQFMTSNIDTANSLIISTNIWATPYYIYFNKTPNYIVFDTKLIPFDENDIDPATNLKEIDYNEIPQLHRPIYVIFNYPSQRISQESYDLLNRLGKEVFRDGNVRIISIN